MSDDVPGAPRAAIPSPRRAVRTPWQIQRAVVFALFVRELKTRFGGRWMGAFWLVLEPLAHVLVLMAIFGFRGRTAGHNIEFPVFLVTGLVPFFAFRNLALRVMDGVDANRGLFAYRQVKPMDALLSRALLELCLYGVVYVVMLAILGWLGFHILPALPLQLFVVTATLLLFGFALGVMFAVVTDDLPRLRPIIRLAFLPLYLLSGVIFPVHTLPADYAQVLLWNPLLHLVELSRAHFFNQYRLIPGVGLAYPVAWTVATATLALLLYRWRRLSLVASG